MTKVCLIIPKRPYLLKQKALPFLGVLQVSSALKAAGHEVSVLDFADGKKYVPADWYGITCLTADFDESIKIKDFIKENNPNAKIILGGPHPTYHLEDCKDKFEYIACGDGEESVPKIIEDNEKIAFGCLKDIDKFHPDREILNMWDYDFQIGGIRATSIVTAYSCAWGKCAFCSRPPKEHNIPRFHSAEWCKKEIKEIADLGFKAIQIYDDEFFTFRERDEQIINFMKEFGIEAWRCFARADFSLKVKDLIKKAVDNNLKEVLIGIESGSKKILEVINKGTTPEMNYEVVKFFSDLGVKVKAAIVIGLPSESKETLKETWDWCEKAEDYVAFWDFTVFTPLPGSDIHKNPHNYDIEFRREDTRVAYKGMHADWEPCPIRTSKLTFDEILKYRDLLEKRFKFKEKVDFN